MEWGELPFQEQSLCMLCRQMKLMGLFVPPATLQGFLFPLFFRFFIFYFQFFSFYCFTANFDKCTTLFNNLYTAHHVVFVLLLSRCTFMVLANCRKANFSYRKPLLGPHKISLAVDVFLTVGGYSLVLDWWASLSRILFHALFFSVHLFPVPCSLIRFSLRLWVHLKRSMFEIP